MGSMCSMHRTGSPRPQPSRATPLREQESRSRAGLAAQMLGSSRALTPTLISLHFLQSWGGGVSEVVMMRKSQAAGAGAAGAGTVRVKAVRVGIQVGPWGSFGAHCFANASCL